MEELLWHCSPDWCRPSFYLRCISGVWCSILRHVPCSCVPSLFSVKRREKDSSMCAAKHLLLWVLEPYMLPLGPRLNPREAKKSHWFLEAVQPHLASVNIREGGLFSCGFLPIKVKFFKIHLSCVNFIKTLIKYFTGVGGIFGGHVVSSHSPN